MATLQDLQWEYRGLVFGEGADIFVDRAEGFEGMEMRTSDSDAPRQDGGLRGLDYVAPRTVAFELVLAELEDVDGSVYEALWAAVRAAFRPSRDQDFDLAYKRPGMPQRVIRCRPVQLVRGEDYLRFNRAGRCPVVLRAVDPRIYSADRRMGNVAVYAANGGGVDFPVDFTAEFTTTAGSQVEFVARNDGTADAYPLVRFYGPTAGTVDGVTLTNTTTGQALDIATEVGQGQTLTADMQAAVTGSPDLVIHLGGASRYGDWTLPREPFALAPGSNVLRFEVTGTSADAIANLVWRDTSLD